MIHDPWATYNSTFLCMMNVQRQKNFPKALRVEPAEYNEGYLAYKRCNNEETVQVGNYHVDNM